MGRESRQARRARERRELQQRRRGVNPAQNRMMIIAGASVVALAVIAFAGAIFFGLGNGSNSASTPTVTPGRTIAGIGCNYGEQTTYHVHAHLTMLNAGKQVALPAFIGFNYDHDCLYWTHTHDASGIIHVEAPNTIYPKLGGVFDVWGKPLSRSRMGTVSVKPGQSMKVYVNQKPYSGNPRNIVLSQHTDITIEVGPPFSAPQKFDFAGHNV